MIKGIIFDFDGVIAQSVEVKTEAFADMYKEYGKAVVNKVVQHHEDNGGMSRFEKFRLYHNTFLNKSITDYEISALADKFSNLVLEKVINSPYVPGVINYVKKSYYKYKLFISTGTPIDEMKEILIRRNIIKYFQEVFGAPNKKQAHVDIILSKYCLKASELIFYGDSNSDLEAANYADIEFVLVKNNNNQTLTSSYNGKIIRNFLDLL